MAEVEIGPPAGYSAIINRNGKHHKTSCNWYDWRNQANTIPRSKEPTNPSDLFEYRNNRLVNTKNLQNKGIKNSVSDPKDVLSKRTVVPGGEARDYNIYAFSQHDNRHKICLPAKKTHGQQEDSRQRKASGAKSASGILNQSKSSNVSETLNWTYHNGRQTSFREKSLSFPPIDHVENSIKVPRNPAQLRRFPKVHNDSVDNKTRDTKILNHNDLGKELLDKKDLLSFQYLAQPQYYTGSKLVNARGKSAGNGGQKDSKKEWHYSFHTHSHSGRVGNSTRYACYRF